MRTVKLLVCLAIALLIGLSNRTDYDGGADMADGDALPASDAVVAGETSTDRDMLTNSGILPDGRLFGFWEFKTTFAKTYYVDNRNPKASDDNDGSKNRPFKTINKAAAVAKAGERVVIKEGVYPETITDVNGGIDEKQMVSFEGEGHVVITGAVKWEVEFKPSVNLRQVSPKGERDLFSMDDAKYYANNGARVYMGEIPAEALKDGYNPFSMLNMSPLYFSASANSVPLLLQKNALDVFQPDAQLMKRGLLFVDGQRLKQVVRPHELWQNTGVYWVDESGRTIHFRLEHDDVPQRHTLELAVKEQGFAPKTSGLSYIRLKNLTFEKYSNPFPTPQKGAVSTNAGHHFIIEDVTIQDVNSIGLDMGFLSHYHLFDGIRGYHIVRNSKFINNGISGISALPTRGEYLKGMLVENNFFSGNCWHNAEPIWELAAIKNHYTEDSLYRNNIITDTYYGAGIWLDKAIKNTRVSNNIIVGVEHSLYGGILIEATFEPNWIDHNFISRTGYRTTPLGVKTGGHGIYLNEADNTTIYGNMIFDIVGDGIFSPYTENPRVVGTVHPRATTGSGNKALHNMMQNTKRAINFPTADNESDGNVIGELSDTAYYIRKENKQVSLEQVREQFGFEANGAMAQIGVEFERESLRAKVTLNGIEETLNLKNPKEINGYIKKIPERLRK
jgi:hypothetical protein